MNNLKYFIGVLYCLIPIWKEQNFYQKLLLIGTQGSGKSTTNNQLVAMMKEKYEYNNTACLVLNERRIDFHKYKDFNFIDGIASDSGLNPIKKYKKLISLIKFLKNSNFEVIVIDSITGMYDIIKNYLLYSGKLKNNAAMTGGYIEPAGEKVKDIINILNNCGNTTVISNIILDKELRKDYSVLYLTVAKDSDGEIHLSNSMREAGIYPPIDLKKLQIRNLSEFCSEEYLNWERQFRIELQKNPNNVIKGVFGLNYIPNIKIK